MLFDCDVDIRIGSGFLNYINGYVSKSSDCGRGPWCGGSRCDARDGACAEGTGRAQGISGGAATGRERPQGGGDPVPPAKNALSAAPQGIMQDAVDASAVQAGARTYGRSFATGDCVPKGHPYTVNGTIHDQSDLEPSAETTTSDQR